MATAMYRLAVCGWDERLPALLSHLEQRASLRPVAVGDSRPMRLASARGATGLPCYQHLLEMARVADYDAVLIETADEAAAVAQQAAARGADLLIRGDCMDAETLSAIAVAAVRHSVALVVLRPTLRRAGCSLLADLIASESAWQPQFVHLELRGDRTAVALLRDAVAATARLFQQTPTEASAAAAGTGEEPDVLVAQLRFPGDALAVLIARPANTHSLRLTVTAPAGSAELESTDDETQLTITTAGGASTVSRLPHGDLDELEAIRVAAVRRGDAVDALLAHREAATLHAIEGSLAASQVRPVKDPTTRAALRVIEGGGHGSSPSRAAQLHVVTR